jgi:hypothetical protein
MVGKTEKAVTLGEMLQWLLLLDSNVVCWVAGGWLGVGEGVVTIQLHHLKTLYLTNVSGSSLQHYGADTVQ